MKSTVVKAFSFFLFVCLSVGACSDPRPTTSPPDSELREQIHAATGHEPPECTDFGTASAEVVVTDTGFEPSCLSVSRSSAITITNRTAAEHRFIVGDPATSLVGRHIRVDEVVPAGGEYTLDPVESLLGEEFYPFWSQGLQDEGYAGTLIVRP